MQVVGLNQFEPQYKELMFGINDINFKNDEIELIGDGKKTLAFLKDCGWEMDNSFNNLTLITDTFNKNGNIKRNGLELEDTIKPIIINQIKKAISHYIKVYEEMEEKALTMRVSEYNEKRLNLFFKQVKDLIEENINSFSIINGNYVEFSFSIKYAKLLDQSLTRGFDEACFVKDLL